MILTVKLADRDRDLIHESTRAVVCELHHIAVMIGKLNATNERIAAALEKQEPPRVPASIRWHVGTPTQE